MESFLSTRRVAQILGVSSATLRSWRSRNKGPRGFVRYSQTHGVYPASEVQRWLDDRKAATATATAPARSEAAAFRPAQPRAEK